MTVRVVEHLTKKRKKVHFMTGAGKIACSHPDWSNSTRIVAKADCKQCQATEVFLDAVIMVISNAPYFDVLVEFVRGRKQSRR